MDFKINGFDELGKRLKQIQKAAEELNGTHSVPFSDLFVDSFMRKYTKLSTIEDFFTSGGFKVASQEDLEAIPETDLDKYVASHSKFQTWKDMLAKAVEEYAARKLGF